MLLSAIYAGAQIDKEQLALETSKAEAENTKKLEALIWKRKTDVMVDGVLKLTTLSEFSFDEQGKLQVKLVDAETTVKDKRGIRGKIQENAVEDNLDYVHKALELALTYTYMSKGQLLDFFEKATINEKGDIIEVTAGSVILPGDNLTVLLDKNTKLFINKKFSSFLDKDPISGEIRYEKFSSGINHATGSILNLPSKKALLNAINQDYSQRVN